MVAYWRHRNVSVLITRRGSIASSRVQAPSTVTVLTLPGTNGNAASTPDSVAASVTGDIDIRAKLAPANWSTTQYVISKQGATTDSSYGLALVADKIRILGRVDAGSVSDLSSSTTTGFADGSVHWIRATRVADTGVATYYTSTDGAAWTQLGTTVGGTTGNWVDSTVPVTIGTGIDTLDFLMFTGSIYHAEIRNGIAGTVVVKYDPSAIAILGTRDPTSLVSSTGETWTMNGSAWDWATV
jgi:hypothetical protein